MAKGRELTLVAAVTELMIEARKETGSTTAACRVVRACAVLGMSAEETRSVLAWLGYYDEETGEPWKPNRIKRVWK